MGTITFNEEVKNIFNTNYETTFTESVAVLEKKRIYLTEAKKAYPHLNESFLIENRILMEDIRVASVSDRCVMDAYHINLAQARNLNKSFKALAIAEHFARTEKNEEIFIEKLNKACGAIILLTEAELEDMAKTQNVGVNKAGMAAYTAAKKAGKSDEEADKAYQDASKEGGAPASAAPVDKATSVEPGATAAPAAKEGPIAASIVPAAGVDPAKADAKKKGFIAGTKEFLTKAWKIVVAVAKSKEFYKALAMGAIMVILGMAAATLGGWFAIGFGTVKAVMGLISVYKGAKELIKTSDFAQGKKGIEGVKEWIKASKDPKNAAKIIIAVGKIAMGAWGASSAIGGIVKDVVGLDIAKVVPQAPAPPSVPHATATPATPHTTTPTLAAPTTPPTSQHVLGAADGLTPSSATKLAGNLAKQLVGSDMQAAGERSRAFAAMLNDAIRAHAMTPEQAAQIAKDTLSKMTDPAAHGRAVAALSGLMK